jgi:hypothetical protein
MEQAEEEEDKAIILRVLMEVMEVRVLLSLNTTSQQ